MTRFRKPGLRERFAQLSYLLEHTATIVGRDHDILTPPIRTILFSAALVTMFFAMIAAYVVGSSGVGTVLLLVWLGAWIYHFFYFNRQELALSWLVFETAAGRDRSFPTRQTMRASSAGKFVSWHCWTWRPPGSPRGAVARTKTALSQTWCSAQ